MSNVPITCYVGMSEASLLRMLTSLESQIEEVSVDISSVSARDSSTTFDNNHPLWAKHQAVQYALWKCDSETYSQPDSAKVKRYYTL